MLPSVLTPRVVANASHQSFQTPFVPARSMHGRGHPVCSAAAALSASEFRSNAQNAAQFLTTHTLGQPTSSEPASSLQRHTDEVEVALEQAWHISDGWRMLPHHLPKQQLWDTIVGEARHDAQNEPALASFLHTTIIMHKTPEKSLAFLLGNKLSSPTLLGVQLTRLFLEAYQDDPDIVEAALADIQAVCDRDPACTSFAQCLLYFKGFQAIQCHRVAHWMWQKGRKTLAIALQSRVSEVYHVDIHPAARIGKGILLDHATGVVIGETAVVGDNCVLLHHVTLGGSGTGHGIRHPNIGNGVLIGAGVIVLGPVSVGRGSKIGAGSVVVQTLPPHCVAVGVPTKVVRIHDATEPVMDMNMVDGFTLDYVI